MTKHALSHRLQFPMGQFKVANYGNDNYAIVVFDEFNNTHSSINLLNKEQLKQIRDGISRVLKDGEEK